MATKELFEAALGITKPWFVVQGVDFEAEKHLLTIAVDFVAGSRFTHPDVPGEHPAHDTRTTRLRHQNFFQHECYLEVRLPRVRLPDGSDDDARRIWSSRRIVVRSFPTKLFGGCLDAIGLLNRFETLFKARILRVKIVDLARIVRELPIFLHHRCLKGLDRGQRNAFFVDRGNVLIVLT
jgi:hypothetical protein